MTEVVMEATSPVRRVLFISAGASHSVALLCKLLCFSLLNLLATLPGRSMYGADKEDFDEFIYGVLMKIVLSKAH